MKKMLKIAWLAAATPLVTGTVIFIAWLLTRADALMVAGAITIMACLCSVTVALVCLAIYLWRNWHSTEVTRLRLAWQAAAVVGMVIMNFVFAAGFSVAAIQIATRYNLSITNEGDEPLRHVRVGVGEIQVVIEDIPAGETRKKGFWIVKDGALVLKATRNGQPIEAVVESYVTHSSGGNMKVTIDPSGEVTAERQQKTGLLSQ